jgi:hypothetical protein
MNSFVASTTPQDAQPLPETVYYGDGSVWVTNNRIVSGARNFWLKNVKTARLRVYSARAHRKVLLISPFVFLTMCLALLISLRDTSLDSSSIIDVGASFVFGFLLLCSIGAAIYLPFYAQALPREDVYGLSLVERFWPTTAVVSTDRPYVEAIAKAVQNAINCNKPNPANTNDPYLYPIPGPPSASLPIPTISGATLQVGASEHNLTNVKSATTSAVQPFPWFTLVIPVALTAQQVLNYIDRFMEWPTWLYSVLSCVLMVAILGYLGFLLLHMSQWIYTVILKTDHGSSIVFASLDQGLVKRLTTEIQQTLKSIPYPSINPQHLRMPNTK